MDSHDVGRGRGGINIALSKIKAKSLIFGIETDYLFPLREQETIQKHIPNARMEIIHSPYGHDGFLIEYEQMTEIVNQFLTEKK
jgi:homoserine O-acetyltransferase